MGRSCFGWFIIFSIDVVWIIWCGGTHEAMWHVWRSYLDLLVWINHTIVLVVREERVWVLIVDQNRSHVDHWININQQFISCACKYMHWLQKNNEYRMYNTYTAYWVSLKSNFVYFQQFVGKSINIYTTKYISFDSSLLLFPHHVNLLV